ncbi:HIRAN domain-containing protein [Citrobacter braakii]|uniref:HIRAN domain-containing protein n=1 Tax=Citrobacter braakii TaxID=57706 RepID=UPI0040394373
MRYSCEIAGIHAENEDGTERKKIVRKYLDPEGDRYAKPVLVREKNNRHDKNAIAVYIVVDGIWNDKNLQIGYLDRETAKEVAYFWDAGGKISDVEIGRVWLPDSPHANPYVHVRFETSWNQEDIDRRREEKRQKERERREARKLAKQAEEERTAREEERKSAEPGGMKAVGEVYGIGPYIWVIVIIFLIVCYSLS